MNLEYYEKEFRKLTPRCNNLSIIDAYFGFDGKFIEIDDLHNDALLNLITGSIFNDIKFIKLENKLLEKKIQILSLSKYDTSSFKSLYSNLEQLEKELDNNLQIFSKTKSELIILNKNKFVSEFCSLFFTSVTADNINSNKFSNEDMILKGFLSEYIIEKEIKNIFKLNLVNENHYLIASSFSFMPIEFYIIEYKYDFKLRIFAIGEID